MAINKLIPTLHPDLLPYYERNDYCPILRHPLISSVPHFDHYTADINRRYEHLKRCAQSLYAKGQWRQFILMHEKPFWLQAFMQCAGIMSDKTYWSTLALIYHDSSEFHVHRASWLSLFLSTRPEKQAVMNAQEYRAFTRLDDILTVYRGGHEKDKAGFSWSLDQDVARWYAHQHCAAYGGNTLIYQANITKQHVLAYFNQRFSQEIILHPEHIKSLRGI